jgi:hypothetical protein
VFVDYKRGLMQSIMKVLLAALFLLLPLEALAGDGFHGAHRVGSYNNRSYVYVYDGRGSRTYGPSGYVGGGGTSSVVRSGGISGPFKNPDPDARKPENLTACMYDAKGVLLYEREGKVCPYKYVDKNIQRVEARRQEWLKAQAKAKASAQ